MNMWGLSCLSFFYLNCDSLLFMLFHFLLKIEKSFSLGAHFKLTSREIHLQSSTPQIPPHKATEFTWELNQEWIIHIHCSLIGSSTLNRSSCRHGNSTCPELVCDVQSSDTAVKIPDAQECCWDLGFVFSSFCEDKTIVSIRNNSIVKYRQKCKLTCVCKTPMIEYIWNSFRIAFAGQKLEYSPDAETKYLKSLCFFLQVWQ